MGQLPHHHSHCSHHMTRKPRVGRCRPYPLSWVASLVSADVRVDVESVLQFRNATARSGGTQSGCRAYGGHNEFLALLCLSV